MAFEYRSRQLIKLTAIQAQHQVAVHAQPPRVLPVAIPNPGLDDRGRKTPGASKNR